MKHACDKASVCQDFIKGHVRRPEHIHTNLFARLSRTAWNDMKAATDRVQQAVATAESKEEMDTLGDQLLDTYLTILDRPGSFLSKSFCISGLESDSDSD